MRKIFIVSAVSGDIDNSHTNPHQPRTAQEIIQCSLNCAGAGASIIHIHAPNDTNSRSDGFLKVFRDVRFLSNALICGSTGGRLGQGLGHRAACLCAMPEIASLTMGDWTRSGVTNKNPAHTRNPLAEFMAYRGVVAEAEIFSPQHVKHYFSMRRAGTIGKSYAMLFLGADDGFSLTAFRRACALLKRRRIPFGVAGLGRQQRMAHDIGFELGASVFRTGLEDNLYAMRGLLTTNEEQVQRLVAMARSCSAVIGSSSEALAVLGS